MSDELIVFIQIGNSDDKLTQAEWASFVQEIRDLFAHKGELIGEWFSRPDTPWQNACWMYKIKVADGETLREWLRELAKLYRQDSIAWTESLETEFLAPATAEAHR